MSNHKNARETFWAEIAEGFNYATKNFGPVAKVLYALMSGVFAIVIIAVYAVAALNPFWFRKALLKFCINALPDLCSRIRNFFFLKYKNKVDLFDTIKDSAV